MTMAGLDIEIDDKENIEKKQYISNMNISGPETETGTGSGSDSEGASQLPPQLPFFDFEKYHKLDVVKQGKNMLLHYLEIVLVILLN